MVTVLAGVGINRRKLRRRLVRAGYQTAWVGNTLSVSPDIGQGTVSITTLTVSELPEGVAESARELLGFRPRDGITCGFDGRPGESVAWPTVIDVARAVAAQVPLAVLDDHAGTLYLIHPGRGLIGPEEYRKLRSRNSTADLLRGLLGDRN